MLGGSMVVSGMCANVKSVISYSLRRVVLIITSRACIREVRDIHGKSVIKCLIGRVILIDTSRAYTRARNHANAVSVISSFHGNLI